LTISSGEVTATKTYHTIDTESDAGSDDLDTIIGDSDDVEGQILIIQAESSIRTVVVKDGTGNLRLNGDFSLTSANDTLVLIYNGSNWCELSRSDNDP
jgi:beta-xylosidase